MSGGVWVSFNDYPGDQNYNGLPGTADESFWGSIGPDHPTGWSWTIVGVNSNGQQWDEAGGWVSTEAEAKAVVEAWRPQGFLVEPVDTDGEPCYTDGMTTTTTDIMTTIDIMTTVALTRVSPAGAALPQYTTNDGAIGVSKDIDGTWAVGPLGGSRPFVSGLDSLEAAVEFILGARALMAPA